MCTTASLSSTESSLDKSVIKAAAGKTIIPPRMRLPRQVSLSMRWTLSETPSFASDLASHRPLLSSRQSETATHEHPPPAGRMSLSGRSLLTSCETPKIHRLPEQPSRSRPPPPPSGVAARDITMELSYPLPDRILFPDF